MSDPPIPSADPFAVPDISRVTFFEGQRLAAFDLNEAALVQRELGWLHNRSLHTWGIGLGYAVTGAKDATQVSISSGYAIDCLGREIILTEPVMRAVPARAHDGNGRPVIYYLVAAYPDDSRVAVLERRQGECDTAGAVRLEERAAIYWKAAGEQAVETGVEIVLAQASVFNCKLALPLSIDQRRRARPAHQPRVGAGASVLGKTGWKQWRIASEGENDFSGLQATIDTSAARFGLTPTYQAQLRGDRVMEQDGRIILLDGTPLVTEGARDRFTFLLVMPPALATITRVPLNPDGLGDLIVAFANENWWVEWIGVEE